MNRAGSAVPKHGENIGNLEEKGILWIIDSVRIDRFQNRMPVNRSIAFLGGIGSRY